MRGRVRLWTAVLALLCCCGAWGQAEAQAPEVQVGAQAEAGRTEGRNAEGLYALSPQRREQTLAWVRRRADRESERRRQAWDRYRRGWQLLGVLRMEGVTRALLLPPALAGALLSGAAGLGGSPRPDPHPAGHPAPRPRVLKEGDWLRGGDHQPVRLVQADAEGVTLQSESGERWRVDF